jgi:hypothetical protein
MAAFLGGLVESHDFCLLGWGFFVRNVVSVGFMMGGAAGIVVVGWCCAREVPVWECYCLLCISWAKHWRLEGEMFVLMKVMVRSEWHDFGVLKDIRLLL